MITHEENINVCTCTCICILEALLIPCVFIQQLLGFVDRDILDIIAMPFQVH